MQKIVLVGNPNTGKTTLFNNMVKANEHVGNWHGVTVEDKQKTIVFKNEKLTVVDLPGAYSLLGYSEEENVTINFLNNNDCLILNVCDINNLKRNLYLTIDLLINNFFPVLIVNVMGKSDSKTTRKLQKIINENLGIKVYFVNANNKKEVSNLLDKIHNECIKNKPTFKENSQIKNLKLKLNLKNNNKQFNIENFESDAQKKYEFINKIFDGFNYKNNNIYGYNFLDKILLNKYLAFPIFLLIIAAVFFITFSSVGKFLSEYLNIFTNKFLFSPLLNFINSITTNNFALKLIEEGIIGGFSSVISFLPQVVLLFLCLNVLELSGYLSRVAFVLEDIFSCIGLSGKSVFALLMGFGCSTTACLTARTLEDKNSKIKTAMLTPYISCSAKLPLYMVVCGAYFAQYSFVIIFLLYLIGAVISLAVSYVLEKTILPSKTNSFIMEFAPLRIPSVKTILKLALLDVKNFLFRVGSVILTFSCIIWIMQNCTFSLKYIESAEQKSILQILSEFLSFLFKPLGFKSYGIVSALICGIVAKEIIVTTLKIMNNVQEGSGLNGLQESFKNPDSVIYFTPQSSLSFLMLSSIYLPCISSMGVLKKEIGLKYTVFACLLEFFVAYICSFLVYKIASVYFTLGLKSCIISLVAFLFVLISVMFIIKFFKGKNKCKFCNKHCKNCKSC